MTGLLLRQCESRLHPAQPRWVLVNGEALCYAYFPSQVLDRVDTQTTSAGRLPVWQLSDAVAKSRACLGEVIGPPKKRSQLSLGCADRVTCRLFNEIPHSKNHARQ